MLGRPTADKNNIKVYITKNKHIFSNVFLLQFMQKEN